MTFLLCTLFLLQSGVASSSVKGKEFFVAFGETYHVSSLLPEIFFVIVSEENTTVHFESPSFGISDISVEANVSYTHGTDRNYYYKGQLTVNTMAFHVTSTKDITLFCYNYLLSIGDGYLALPVTALSTNYILVTHNVDSHNPSIFLEHSGKPQTFGFIIGTEASTSVGITLAISGSNAAGGCGGTFFDGQSTSVTLNKGEIAGIYCDDDITGTVVTSDKPVAVIAGINLKQFTFSFDHIVEMLLPVNLFGLNFVLPEPIESVDGVIYRIMSSQPSTNIRISSVPSAPLNTGDYIDQVVNANEGALYLEADKPVQVIQFSQNLPAMALVQPTSLFSSSYSIVHPAFLLSPYDVVDTKVVYITVIVPTDRTLGITPSIFPQFKVIKGTCFAMSTTTIDRGVVHLYHEDGIVFGAMVSMTATKKIPNALYTYPGGFDLNNVASKHTCTTPNCNDGTPFPCSCGLGYFEYQCNDTTSGCTEDPCYYGSECLDQSALYECNCTAGVAGSHCETDVVDDCFANSCLHGICVDGINSYTCSCSAGFDGLYCDNDINECADNPCVHGTCNDLINMYNCSCDPGYQGFNCSVEINECDSDPCINGTCVDLIDDYNCTCIAGYKGVNCSEDIDECVDSPCLNGSSCSNLPGTFNCSCEPGYEGALCETDIDECSGNPCVNGTCNNLVNMYNCTCDLGFEGIHCETEINECDTNPCGNGTCTDLVGTYNCSCISGYMGFNCDEDINECDGSPCQNDGACNNWPGSYNCTCLPGFEGTICETDINECDTNPCVHGSCNDLANMYNCTCDPGYEGVNCDQDIDECATGPCLHDGVCNEYLNFYNCTCQPGYEGKNCETDIDDCATNPCVHGTCNDFINAYNCSCTAGYEGLHCDTDINECATDPCLNGGACQHYIDFYNCTCLPGYEGNNCETDIDDCAVNPCIHGSCNDQVNDYACTCIPGYEGVNCDTETDECGSSPCLNSGNCTDVLNGFLCTCPEGINGTRCEIGGDPCATNPCLNNGTCTQSSDGFNCTCPPGIEGEFCQTDTDECASSPCKNDGTCEDKLNAFECICQANFTGLLCEVFQDCGCFCFLDGNMSDIELAARLRMIRSLLLIDKNTLSKTIRTKVSIQDFRPSATGIGFSGMSCLIAAFGFFIFMDGLNFLKAITSKTSPEPLLDKTSEADVTESEET